MKTVFAILIAIHGLIHLLGPAKAFGIAPVDRLLTQPISKPAGTFWLAATFLFLASLWLLTAGDEWWWIVSLVAILVSQTLIILAWRDAKFGTLANILILVPTVIAFLYSLPSSYRNIYDSEVCSFLEEQGDSSIIAEQDLESLPSPVQRYLRYSGVIGKPRVWNFRALWTGTMKMDRDSDWMEFRAEQVNTFHQRTRLFYIESSIFGIPFNGLHRYVGDNATMQVKIASLLQIVDGKGEKMNQGETVTIFNDMCVLAPATLIDPTIRWETIDSLSAKATFTNEGQTISATLHFNEAGQLINFFSDDRFMSSDGATYTQYTWSTPLGNYRNFGGRNVPTAGQAIWHLPEGKYTYGRFILHKIKYNVHPDLPKQ